MSGASALAAAKRRRAAAAEPTRPTSASKPNQIPKPNQPSVSSQGQGQAQVPSQNPLQLLLQHEQRLLDLEKGVNQLKLTDKKTDVMTPDTLNYFKTQQELLSQEIQDLKKIIIKVQTFSMETNLEVLKIKKTLKLVDAPDPV